MKHDSRRRIRELCALELYDELDAADAAELARLRAGSPELARLADEYAAELTAGLGALPARADPHFAFPADWHERLRAEVEREAPRGAGPARFPVWLTAAAGFAAGALLVWSARDETPRTHRSDADSVFERFLADEPPPTATAGGGLDRFSRYIR